MEWSIMQEQASEWIGQLVMSGESLQGKLYVNLGGWEHFKILL